MKTRSLLRKLLALVAATSISTAQIPGSLDTHYILEGATIACRDWINDVRYVVALGVSVGM